MLLEIQSEALRLSIGSTDQSFQEEIVTRLNPMITGLPGGLCFGGGGYRVHLGF